MTIDDYESLFSAREVICDYCCGLETCECPKCIITRLMDDAQAEYEDLIEDEDEK